MVRACQTGHYSVDAHLLGPWHAEDVLHVLQSYPGPVLSLCGGLFPGHAGQGENMSSFKRLHVFADVGGHFRNGYTIGWICQTLLQEVSSLDRTTITFFPEGHGKGACDSHFGHMSAWFRHV